MLTDDLRACSLPSNGGVLRRDNYGHSGSGSGVFSVDLDFIAKENWERAEEAAEDILQTVHPTPEADCRRKEVAEYIRGLIKSSLGFEVFPYGSVPLKTYLPDGDIDLTAISSSPVEDTLFSDVHTVLKREEQKRDTRCQVKDVHFIDAEVKLVKCIVRNMVVDISFNQLGGLSTLCFLEQVDRFVGKDHLFKRSIILIKSWCYYESRILGAHHGLISTYALEILVLYIFNLFHSSLHGPLAVLYRFLDYYSKFDWDNYWISLNGPVCKTLHPNIGVEPFENRREKLLLEDEFLKKCIEMFSVQSKNPELNSRPFPQKHLNVVDPLKANNNLGRSVNRGNFYRIRSAFKYGARKLGWILALPSERMSCELNKIFGNTLDRHKSSHSTHLEDPPVLSCPRNSNNSLSSSSFSSSSSDDGKSTLNCSVDRPFDSHFSIINGISNGKATSVAANDGEVSCAVLLESKENHILMNNSACSCTNIYEGKRETAGIPGIFNSSEQSMDLSGDYDSHFSSFLYGHYSHFYALPAHIPSHHPMLTKLKSKNHWKTIRESLQLNQHVHLLRKENSILGPNPTLSYQVPFSEAFTCDENKKRRGTGTYIPNTLYYSNEDRRGKNQASGVSIDSLRNDQDKGCDSTSTEVNSSENCFDLSEAEYPYLGNGKHVSSQPLTWVLCNGNDNGNSSPPDTISSGSQVMKLPENSLERLEEFNATSSPTEIAEDNGNERVAFECYHLKDEVDFPPLSLGR